MPRKKDSSQQRDALRRKAEKQAQATRAEIQQMSMKEIQRLVHELQIHQIELNIQNEELRNAHLDLEQARDQYQELYEWAPVGYAVLNARATIVQANLRLSELLGVERTHLMRRRFKEFIAYTDQSRFTRYWRDALAATTTQMCEVRLESTCPAQTVLLKSRPVQKLEGKADHCLVAVIDITQEQALKQSLETEQARLNGIVGSAMDAIITVDEDQRIILFNAAAERLFRCPAAEALGQPINRFIPERFRAAHRDHIRTFAQAGSTSRRMGGLGLIWGLRTDGEEVPLEASISQVEVGGNKYLTVIHRNISERLHMEQALRQEQDFVSAVLDTAGALIVVLDPEGRIVRFNRACERTTGFTAEEVIGRRVWDLFLVSEEVEPVKAVFEQLRTSKAPNTYENYWRTKDGDLRWIVWSSTVLPDDQQRALYVIGTGIDRTDQKRVEQALERRRHELQALTGRLIRAQEDERKRLARELHDDASQRLASILFELDRIQDAMGLSNLQRRHLLGLRRKIASLYDDVHGLSYALHPKILDDLGLDAAIRSLIREIGRYAALDIGHRMRQVPADLPAPVALCCYRVIQQAVDNAVRHAQASRIRVTIAGLRAWLGVCVADDGRGFDPSQTTHGTGLGLLGMKERALALSGTLRVRSSPGHGTHVHLLIPFREIQPFHEGASSG